MGCKILHAGDGRVKGWIKSYSSGGKKLEINDSLDDVTERDLRDLQIAIYVMAGGGFLANHIVRQPGDSHYYKTSKKIRNAIELLIAMAVKLGKDPHYLEFKHLAYTGWYLED